MAEFRLFVSKEVRKYRKNQERSLTMSLAPSKSPVAQLLSPTLPRNPRSFHHSKKELVALETLTKEATKVVPCGKGMAAMSVAVLNMMKYDPQARRWKERGLEVQQFMCEHMTLFQSSNLSKAMATRM